MSGRLDIVGLGPGGAEHRTASASAAVIGAQVVIGYGPYVEQCADLLHGQEVVRGAMGEEAQRADEALRRAAAGARVALVSSGDAGVHGMAARTLARAAALPEDERPAIEVVPGVTAALAAGALLGAPLGDDFAALSLSDLHVAWEVVERRLTAVAAAGSRSTTRARGRGRGSSSACSRSCASIARTTRRSRSSPTPPGPESTSRRRRWPRSTRRP
jgi:precorrin-3B C17-methyltransferase